MSTPYTHVKSKKNKRRGEKGRPVCLPGGFLFLFSAVPSSFPSSDTCSPGFMGLPSLKRLCQQEKRVFPKNRPFQADSCRSQSAFTHLSEERFRLHGARLFEDDQHDRTAVVRHVRPRGNPERHDRREPAEADEATQGDHIKGAGEAADVIWPAIRGVEGEDDWESVDAPLEEAFL